ncbi:MAG: hypothetical protein K2M27_04480 [Muribaculaceae bacterium]|nr:hypothetical protein [Muribaculaceae bacterium]
MNTSLFPDSLFKFIADNINESPSSLRFRFHGKSADFDTDLAITQIECRKKYHRKLVSFICNPHFIFPSSIAAEQASHEAIAKYHASLFSPEDKVIDMTAGLGIDSMTVAKNVKWMAAYEYDRHKALCLSHNKSVLGIDNMTVYESDSTTDRILWDNDVTIFIDPARRNGENARMYNLHDCTPDILSLQDEILDACKCLIIKASPLLDISRTITDIPHAFSIRCVCVEGECKEVLVMAKKRASLSSLEAVNLARNGISLSEFKYNPDETGLPVTFATMADLSEKIFLYEPDAAVMKFAPWKIISSRFNGILKMGPSSHLFISNNLFSDFPGRTLRIKEIIHKKGMKSLKGLHANVVSRNHPLSADDLRKRLGIKEGKDSFIYGTRICDKPVLILAERL